MGLRGPGGRSKAKAREAVALSGEALPWEEPGLDRAAKMIAFLEWLPITKGLLAGEKMRLLPEQRTFVQAVYGSDVRIAVLSEPRGNGKTGLLCGLALGHLLGPESEPRGEIYSAAIDRAQAALLFSEMEAVIVAVPEFDCRVNIVRFHKKLEVLDGDGEGSVYEALSADARRAHGLSPTLWVYDEMAQAKNRELLDNLTTAMGKRQRSLGIVISTQAPRDDHPLSELIDDGLKGIDPGVYVQLISAPDDADPFDEAVIRECNPAVGHFLQLDELMRQAQQAKRMPNFEARFRNLRLNQRVSQNTGLVPASVWKECGKAPWDEAFENGVVTVGLDLSARNDLTAIVYVAELKGEWHVRAHFFAPEEGIEERGRRDQAEYSVWAKDGYITLTPGHSVDYETVAKKLIEICDDYDVKDIGFDRWRIDVLNKELMRLGAELPLRSFGQGFKDMSPAVDFLESALLNGKIRHGENPVLTMCALNAAVDTDAAGNRKLNKDRSFGRIDGMVAMAMAVGIASSSMDEPEKKYQVLFV
jgi:phage terminase large subunit-like protein